MSKLDTANDNQLKHKAGRFVESFLERKFFLTIYTILEKWVLLHLIVTKQLILSQDVLILIFGKDIMILIIVGLISVEKIKLSIQK